jgi:hypothetical protein
MDFNDMKGSVRDRKLMVILCYIFICGFISGGTTLPVAFVATALVQLPITDYDLRNIHQDMKNAMKGIDINTQNIAFIHLKCLLVCDCSAST